MDILLRGPRRALRAGRAGTCPAAAGIAIGIVSNVRSEGKDVLPKGAGAGTMGTWGILGADILVMVGKDDGESMEW